MSAWRNDIAKCKGKIPPAVRGNANWRGTCLVLTLAGGKSEVGGGGDVAGVDRLESGARSWALCAFPLVLFSCPAKSDKWQL